MTRMKRHIKPTNMLTEEYLWNETAKANQTLAADGLNELIDHFKPLHKSDEYNRTEMEGKDSVNKDNTRT